MNNPKYSHLLNTAVRPDSTQLLEKYIQAARFDVNNIDVDIQIGLGVLFNVVGDYAKSIDCFSTVVNIQPNDYASLNKLGATFANSKRHSEAVSCYKRALALKNCYGRARYNLGLSLVALGEYDKAVRELVLACVEGGDACWRMLRQVVYGYHNDLAGVLDEAMAKRDIVFLKKYFNL